MSKRIALAIDSLTGGGAEKIVLTLADEFLKTGNEVHIFVMHDERLHTIPKGVYIHPCFDLPLSKIISVFNIKRSIQQLKDKILTVEAHFGIFDLFISNLDTTNLLMVNTGVKPLYCVVHSPIEESLQRQIRLGPVAYFYTWRSIKALEQQNLICVSQGVADQIKQVKRIIPKSITTIYNPFNQGEINRLAAQENPQIPDIDYIIHVGRFARSKRHDVLFSALKLMKNDIKLVILCKNTKKAAKAAKRQGVIDKVIIPGFQPNPFPWIKQAKLLVLSSDYEGLPTVLIESLACGTPVVSTDCNYGPKEIMTDELAAFLVPRRNPAELAAKIDLALLSPPALTQPAILSKVAASTVAEAYIKLI
jgi:glycosyltransferase involved in cell wall biosynthesis